MGIFDKLVVKSKEKGMKKDVISTVLFSLILVAIGVWGGINSWAGATDLVPFVMWFIILPAFVIVEGKRIRNPIVCVAQAMTLNLLFVGASLPFYQPPNPLVTWAWYEDPDILLALICPTGAMGLLALSSTGVPGIKREKLIVVIGFLGGALFFPFVGGFAGGFFGFLIFGGLATLILPRVE